MQKDLGILCYASTTTKQITPLKTTTSNMVFPPIYHSKAPQDISKNTSSTLYQESKHFIQGQDFMHHNSTALSQTLSLLKEYLHHLVNLLKTLQPCNKSSSSDSKQ